MADPTLSILVATLDEEATIEACVRRVLAVFPTQAEILVVTGGTDRTAEIVQSLARVHPQVRCIPNPNDRGKGHAIRTAIAHARAPIHAQIDADLQFAPEELPSLIAPIVEGRADVVLGSRFARGSTRRAGSTPVLRTLGNFTVSAFASLLFGQRMTDVLAGMKAWSADAIREISPLRDDYSYEVEIPTKALLRSLRVLDVPITTEARRAGRSNVRVLPAGLALLRDVALFRLKRA